MSVLSKLRLRWDGLPCCALLVFLVSLAPACSADTNAVSTTNDDSERAYLQIQEIIEENRQALDAAASNTVILDQRLRGLENALADTRAAQQRSLEHSNTVILAAASGVAAIGILSLMFAAFLQWTAINRLAGGVKYSTAPPLALPGLEGRGLEQASMRFLGLTERLEQRIRELEGSAHAHSTLTETLPALDNGASGGKAAEISVLFDKSQTLLKLDKPEAALRCLDELLELDPENTQALVKRGAALERLQRLDEAVESYDRAIARDHSMTIAYLAKGGVFNRMERYGEALACYEQALKKPAKNPDSLT